MRGVASVFIREFGAAATQAELRRARGTKADRLFWFDELPRKAVYQGKFNAPMLWNSNFFMTLESMKILHLLTDVWLPDFKFGPGRCAMALAKTLPHVMGKFYSIEPTFSVSRSSKQC
jgi:hypothetical protein